MLLTYVTVSRPILFRRDALDVVEPDVRIEARPLRFLRELTHYLTH